MIFTEIKPGQSVQNEKIPVFKSEKKSHKYLYLMAGVHGDEVEGVFVLKNLFEFLKTEVDREIPLIVIPILNVDGYRMGQRINSHGIDLNRNLPTKDWTEKYTEDQYNPGPAPLSEPENGLLKKLFEKYPPYFMMSFHSWKPMINVNGDCLEVANFLNQYNNYTVADDIGYPTPGSLGTYLPESYNCPVITFECPKISSDKSLKDIWEENQMGLKAWICSDLAGKAQDWS